MQQAAAECRFEQAAVLRDDWTELSWLVGMLDQLEEARRVYTFVYSLQGRKGWVLWLLIRQGKIVGAVRQPRTAAAARRVLGVLETCRTATLQASPVAGVLDVSPLLLAWFQRNPEEMQKTLSWRTAIVTCRRLTAVRGTFRATA
jgi:excinuclease UvrABC nuclease subunit